jgi:hypothetical protein
MKTAFGWREDDGRPGSVRRTKRALLFRERFGLAFFDEVTAEMFPERRPLSPLFGERSLPRLANGDGRRRIETGLADRRASSSWR